MNWWQWLLTGIGVLAAWFVIACALAWVLTGPYRRLAAGSGPHPPVREAAAPERPPLPGSDDWVMSMHWKGCACVHFLDHRARRRVITLCDKHQQERDGFSVAEWNERLERS